jgi:trans-aconitate methyltransferase
VKYIALIATLCIVPSLCTADKPTRDAQEWDAKAYDQGCDLQTTSFLEFLKKNNIVINNRTILDVGCGTGNLSAVYACDAQEVHAFDASHNMIEHAQKKHSAKKNLFFNQCFAEDLNLKPVHQLALVSSAFHWFTDKKQALQKINDSLQEGGELFCDVRTMENPKPINLTAAGKIISQIPFINWFIDESNIMNHTGSSYPTTEELHTMLSNTHFEIIKCEQQSLTYEITKEELKLLEWPIVTSRPIMPWIRTALSENNIKYWFESYIDQLSEEMLMNKDGKYLYPIDTTIVHARKKVTHS